MKNSDKDSDFFPAKFWDYHTLPGEDLSETLCDQYFSRKGKIILKYIKVKIQPLEAV